MRARSLWRRDGGRCWYCGGIVPEPAPRLPGYPLDDRAATREHLVPAVAGGPTNGENLVLAHHACNLLAGRCTIEEKRFIRDWIRSNGGFRAVPRKQKERSKLRDRLRREMKRKGL